MAAQDAAIALNRFGLGARPDDPVAAIARDPRGWLKGQQARWQPRTAETSRIAPRAEVVADWQAHRTGRREARMQAAADPANIDVRTLTKAARSNQYRHNVEGIDARVASALATDTPFAERLTHFWSNHFAISGDKVVPGLFAADYEFNAIRPNIYGSFGALLAAAVKHPAMLTYLDQAASIGPDSPFGSRRNARNANRTRDDGSPTRELGINENLAREILELHTLGVRAGYGQQDVTEFARALTGWTVAGIGQNTLARQMAARQPETAGDTLFITELHQPGSRTIMGKSYADNGAGQAGSILADLAVHPATARHVATKLVRHFVADTPPPAAVARVEKAFIASRGDLPAVYAALIDAPEAWAQPLAKFKSPWDWSVSALRGLGVRQLPGKQPAIRLFTQLGQPVWRPGSPAGWDDVAASWTGAQALMNRVELAERFASRVGDRLDARALGAAILPGTLGQATGTAIARADSPGQGLALLLVSPEFLRR